MTTEANMASERDHVPKGGFALIFQNPYLLGVASVRAVSRDSLTYKQSDDGSSRRSAASSSAMIRASCPASSPWNPSPRASLACTPTAASRAGSCRRCFSVCPHQNHRSSIPPADMTTAAWFGSLVYGPVVDRLGRKRSINVAVVIFVVGSALQCAAVSLPMLFVGTPAPPRP